MFSFAPLKKRFSLGSSKNRVDIPSVDIHDIETSPDRRARTLKHLLKANHANHSIIYHDLEYNNHMPHILGAAYLLGTNQEHLNDIYDNESKDLEAWTDAPGEITLDDWREYLGKRHYQRAYVDFFEDQLVRFGYDWQELVRNFLFDGEKPLVNNLIASLAHPLIHMSYAFELQSQTTAIEALAMTCCSYNFLHKYVDDATNSLKSAASSKSILEILADVRADSRFDGVYDSGGSADLQKLFTEREAAALEYWSAWEIVDPKENFKESQLAAVSLLLGTAGDGPKAGQYDFFMVHLVTSSHAVRVLLPLIPAEFHIKVIKQWWLLTLATYIAQGRPEVKALATAGTDISETSWKSIVHKALTGGHALDSHYIKAIRAMQEAARLWTAEEPIFLTAASKFSEDFEQWKFK